MPSFVADASITLAWCFEDETTAWTESLLDRLLAGEQALVPAHWPTEVSNGLLMASRRGRLEVSRVQLLWDNLSILPIMIEPPLSSQQAKDSLALAERYRLTVYDAAYLELARRKSLPLATLDKVLKKAASEDRVQLVP